MIRLPLAQIPLAYAAVCLAVILALWLLYEHSRARRARLARRNIGRCRLCAQPVRFGGKRKLYRCPACGALNEPEQINLL